MARMVGADVEALERLAYQFDQAADRLLAQTGQVGNGIQIGAWVGPVATRFRIEWDSTHSVSLRSAAEALKSNAAVLRRNAADQARASDALGVWGTIPTFPKLEFHGGNSPQIEQLLKEFLSLGKSGSDAFFAFMESLESGDAGFFAELSPSTLMSFAMNFGEAFDVEVPRLGSALSALQQLDLVGRTISGDAHWAEWVGEVGSWTKNAPNPYVRLGGVAVQSWAMVFEEASKADFSAKAFSDTAKYARENLGVVAEEVAKATVQVGLKVFNMLPFKKIEI